MSRRGTTDRGARPDPTKAEVALRWKVKILPEGEVQVTDVRTTPYSDTSKMNIAGFCAQKNISLVAGQYVLRFGVHNGMSDPVFPKELDSESRVNLYIAFIPDLAINASALSTEFARFPSDIELHDGVIETVTIIFERLMRLEGECGEIPENIDYSHIRPGFISVIGVECAECMGLPGQKMHMGEVLHKFLAVYDSLCVSFGNGMAMIGFDTGECVVKVGYRHLSHEFVFAHSVNNMLAKRFAKILAEVEGELMAQYSRDTFKFYTDTIRYLLQIADNYGFAISGSEPVTTAEHVPTAPEEPITPVVAEGDCSA